MRRQDGWLPERFFYSHATSDDRLTALVTETLESGPGQYQVYAAERGLVGRPLMEKLRDELLDCNAMLVGWTTSASSRSSEIISFEVGMAFSLDMPVYILRCGCLEMPWFFSNLTDYADLRAITAEEVGSALSKIEPRSFYHPLDLSFPRKEEPVKQQSKNADVVHEDGSILLPPGFNDIVHFNVVNRRQHPERDVRVTLTFPQFVAVEFDSGTQDGTSGVQRNEIFDMWQAPAGTVRLYWSSLSLDTMSFELRLRVDDKQSAASGCVQCRVSSSHVVGWRCKEIPLRIVVEDGAAAGEPPEQSPLRS